MRKSRFSDNQIVRILKQVEGGRKVKEVCRVRILVIPITCSGFIRSPDLPNTMS